MTKHEIIKVLLVEKNDDALDEIKSILWKIDFIEVIAVAKDNSEAIQLTSELQPDIVILDLNTPNSPFEKTLKQLIDISPTLKIITMSLNSDSQYVLRAFNSGVSGYVLKDRAYEGLPKAICAIGSNKNYISPGIAGIVKDE